MIPKILAIIPEPWYMNVYADYIARYLGDEFQIEVGSVPAAPYDHFQDRFPQIQLGCKNPDEYDLLWPVWPGYWGGIDRETYSHKMTPVLGMPNESPIDGVAVVGAASPVTERSLAGKHFHSLRYGLDPELFKPYPMVRDDDLLHVGMVGTIYNCKRAMNQLFPYINNIPGTRIMFSTNHYIQRMTDLDLMGGWEARCAIVEAMKPWVTLPNTYNRLDVILRTDQDPGISFPVIEAAACGVPCIATDCGIDHIFTEAGGGILIKADKVNSLGEGRSWYIENVDEVGKRFREAIVWMRDHQEERKEMGRKAREEILKNWTLEKVMPAWREFFREGMKNVKK